MAIPLFGVVVTRRLWARVVVGWVALSGVAFAQSADMSMWKLRADDRPSDGGDAILLFWGATPPAFSLTSYEVQRAKSAEGPFETVATVPATDTQYVDGSTPTDEIFYYRIAARVEGPAATIDTPAGSLPAATTNVSNTFYTSVAGPTWPLFPTACSGDM